MHVALTSVFVLLDDDGYRDCIQYCSKSVPSSLDCCMQQTGKQCSQRNVLLWFAPPVSLLGECSTVDLCRVSETNSRLLFCRIWIMMNSHVVLVELVL